MDIIRKRFSIHGDERGNLVAIEAERDIPFPIKRVYYIYGNTQDVRRGFHAHKQLEQYLICVSGECKIRLDDGAESKNVVLNDPGEGLYIGPSMWREMYDFSPDAVLMVLASDYYSEDDYIREYDGFLQYLTEAHGA